MSCGVWGGKGSAHMSTRRVATIPSLIVLMFLWTPLAVGQAVTWDGDCGTDLWIDDCGADTNWDNDSYPTALKVAPAAAGALLILAGAVQFSPLKNACLTHCRSPVGYFLTRWRNGPRGAFSMGFHHGVYCLGCCWALMALAFALGTMNLVWMAAVTLMLCAEKIAPGGQHWSKVFGVAFFVWGAVVLFQSAGGPIAF